MEHTLLMPVKIKLGLGIRKLGGKGLEISTKNPSIWSRSSGVEITQEDFG